MMRCLQSTVCRQLQTCHMTTRRNRLTLHTVGRQHTGCSTDLCPAGRRRQALDLLEKTRKGLIPPDKPSDEVYWTNDPKKCPSSALPAVINYNCPHPSRWMYLKVDANLAVSCQNKDEYGGTPETREAGEAMLKCDPRLPPTQLEYAASACCLRNGVTGEAHRGVAPHY
jgi:hypothetical protein